ncbi:MAG: hypothetical protein ACN2B6_03295 [Rickettsiales bacterium]
MSEDATNSGGGIGEALKNAADAFGDKAVEVTSEMAGKAIATAGAAMAAIPIVGSLLAGAMQEAASAGSGKSESIAPSVTPVKAKAPEVEAPAVEKDRTIVLPAAALAAVNAIKEGTAQGQGMEVASATGYDLGNLGSPLPAQGKMQEVGMGGRSA